MLNHTPRNATETNPATILNADNFFYPVCGNISFLLLILFSDILLFSPFTSEFNFSCDLSILPLLLLWLLPVSFSDLKSEAKLNFSFLFNPLLLSDLESELLVFSAFGGINSSSVFKSKSLFSALGDSFSSGFNSGVIGVVGCTGIVGCVGNTGILCYTIIYIINFSIRLSR